MLSFSAVFGLTKKLRSSVNAPYFRVGYPEFREVPNAAQSRRSSLHLGSPGELVAADSHVSMLAGMLGRGFVLYFLKTIKCCTCVIYHLNVARPLAMNTVV